MSENEVQELDLSVPSNEDEADALIDQAQAQEGEKGPIKDSPTQAQVDSWNAQEWAFKVAGKDVIPKSRDEVRNWAQLGYGANHRISELNKQLGEWKTKEKQLNELHGKYNEIDDYVRKNPQFWQHVMNSWQNRAQAISDPNNPLAQTVGQLANQVQDLVQYKQTIEQQQQTYRMKQEDDQYLNTFEDLRKSYPQIDLVTPDENGKTKEYHMLEYALQNGIKNLKTAFRDYFHDDLVKIAAEQAKVKVAKDRQKDTKLGILGRSTTPTKGISSDHKGKSYNDLANEALAELGLTN